LPKQNEDLNIILFSYLTFGQIWLTPLGDYCQSTFFHKIKMRKTLLVGVAKIF
jgi:hypothetical protein